MNLLLTERKREEMEKLRSLLRMTQNDGNETPCFYCGVPSTEREHTVPKAYIEAMEAVKALGGKVVIPKQKIVDTCIECNRVAGGVYRGTPQQRKRFVQIELKKKYRKVLQMPDWTDEELLDLDRGLREYTLIYAEFKKLLKKRVNY